MDYKEFIDNFSAWVLNGNNKRKEAREIFALHKHDKKFPKGLEWIEYVNSQPNKMRFLDGMFSVKKNGKNPDLIKKNIVDCVYSYTKENGYVPVFNVINNMLGFRANKYFSTEKDIIEEVKKSYCDFEKYVCNEADFDDEYRDRLLEAVKKHKRFMITTAVSGKKVSSEFLKSIENWLNHNDAICLILPCEDTANRKSAYDWQLPAELKRDRFFVVHNDTYLNDNLYICDIKISAKQINPKTGLMQFTHGGSVIIASPKQDLDYVANSNNELPAAIMTTGAITENDYSNDAFMSQRLNKIAEFEHVLGAIVVEIQNDKIFHFRQVQLGANGEFIDLAKEYCPDGTIRDVSGTAMVIGDSHFGEHDNNVVTAEYDIIRELNVRDLVMHDVFSGISINPHNSKKTITGAKNANNEQISLEKEANFVACMLDSFADRIAGVNVIVHSNHHEFLDRYLEEGKYAFDKINLSYCLDIVKAMIEGEKLPLRYMIEKKTCFKSSYKTKWLEPDEDYSIYGIVVSQHGNRADNGKRGGGLNAYRKAYKKSISAHTHTPRIYRGAVCVGTSSNLRLGYNIGLSSWVQGVALIYPNGTFQLINIIQREGKYYWKI